MLPTKALRIKARRYESTFAPSLSRILSKGRYTNNNEPKNSKQNAREEEDSNSSALSALPTSILLRSILINSISSKPLLLTPALSILSTLSQPRRSFLLNVDRNRALHWLLKHTFYAQFCAGETAAEALATTRQLRNMGFRGTILTYAKETVFDHHRNEQRGLGVAMPESAVGEKCENIEAWREGTVRTVDILEEGDQLAVKLTGAGPLVTQALSAGELPNQQMMDALHEICRRCQERGARILIDAESQHFQWGIMRVSMELMRKYNTRGHALVYNTYQAYLKSTPKTLQQHLAMASDEGFTLGLKLVRGAYLTSEQRSLIHDTKAETDAAYNSMAQGALRQELGEFGAKDGRPFPSVELVLAGHNQESVSAAYALHSQRTAAGLPTVPVGFAQLQGMSDEVSFGLLRLKRRGGGEGPDVFKCSTWGSLGECVAYLTRRAIENKGAAGRTRDEYAALKKEVGRRVRRALGLTYWFGAR